MKQILLKTALLFFLLSVGINTYAQQAGELDLSFNPGTGTYNPVWCVALQPDSKVLIGGSFVTYNGVMRGRIARLNADGSIDTTFNTGSGASDYVFATTLQPDGKVLIGGWFTSYNSIVSKYIARLNADGSLDTTFNQGTGVSGIVYSIALQPDGKIIIGGDFGSYNGVSQNNIGLIPMAALTPTLTPVPGQTVLFGL
jgi:uncharacterized delta-60 repeat protein